MTPYTPEPSPQKGKDYYRKINREVMTDTKQQYETDERLREAVRQSIQRQYMVAQEDDISQSPVENSSTAYVCSGRRTFEAARYYAYIGKKVAVLNFANNHSIGGAPFSAGAQEESLCRCSTLLPCLEAMRAPFYEKHRTLYEAGKLGLMGNDDLIYTPGVLVFKDDRRAPTIYPRRMPLSGWYNVDVITCAAPEMKHMHHWPDDYKEVIARRIKKILDAAAREKVQVLILGAWGCGAFGNDLQVVADTFRTLLKNYDFETVEYALGTDDYVGGSPFAQGCKVDND